MKKLKLPTTTLRFMLAGFTLLLCAIMQQTTHNQHNLNHARQKSALNI